MTTVEEVDEAIVYGRAMCHEFDGADVDGDELIDTAFDSLGLDGDTIARLLAARWELHRGRTPTELFTNGFVEGLFAGALLTRREQA